MKRNLIISILPVIIISFFFGYTVTCGAQSPSNRKDEEAIKKVIVGTTEAFNKHDAKEFTRFYTPDAELVTVRGERMKGAAEIEKGLAAIFATRAKAVTLKTLDVTVRFIRPDVAIAHVTNELSGLVGPGGEQLPAHNELSIRVLVKEKGRWLINAFHNTVVRPVEPPASLAAGQQPQTPPASKTRIVMLGTGNPGPDPDRSGPATAIVVNDTAYLVDFGPGVVRRASAAFLNKGIKALEPTKLRVAFVTHLHSDHTVGYPDLIFTPWTVGRRVPLEVYGPKGLKSMTEHLLEAYRVDIDTRTNPDGNQRGFPEGYKVNAHEVGPGVVYKDANVTVTAFATNHAMESYGYRFDTADRSIVISGDTNPTQATIDACRGCDVLIHEAYTPAWLVTRPDFFQQFAAKFHTSTTELAELARKAKPRLLILYHYSSLTPEELQDEMRVRYSGHFVVGRDLDVY